MPLSELIYRLAKEKFDSSQEKNSNCSTDKPQGGENDFGELVWENGQIQSNKGRKFQNSNQNSKLRDKDLGNGNNLRMGRFGVDPIDSGVDEVPSGLHQDDDVAPWLNYPIDDFLQQDYCSEFLSELSGVTAHEHSQNSNNNNNNQSIRGSNTSSSQLYPLPSQQSQSSFPYSKSRVLPSTHELVNRPLDHDSSRVSSSSNPGLMNFAHFSRPVAIAKANLQNIGMRGGSSIERTGSNKDKSLANDSFCKPVEPRRAEEPVLLRKIETLDRGDESKTDKYFAESANKGFVDGEKGSEPIVASSSVCSGNSVERVSDEPVQNMKRKNREADSSEGPSEENEEELVGTKKGAHSRGGTGCKRTRAAKVHNLSERRRRDRINEKMRALQELIPNCNKVDKASMLDEAIEYLKTLQLQVQIMSMGSGLYMPSMMMTPMHAAHMAQFSPMGVGMGMGFGMGMPDMMGGSPGCSMVQMPPHFPGPPMPGPSGMRGMGGGSGFPMFGVSSQGHPMQYPCPPMMPMPGPPVPSPMGGSVDNLGSGPGSSSKDLIRDIESNPVRNDGANGSMNQTATQCQVTKENGETPALVQASEVNGALKPAKGE